MNMQKVRLLTDSACDISKEDEAKSGIQILGFPITIDGKGYRERESFTNQEFYRLMDEASEIPRTAQITAYEFEQVFNGCMAEGVTHLIYVAINSTGSNTFNAAQMAKETFFKHNPEALGKMEIYVLDSKGYTAIYGYPLLEAAKKLEKGAAVKEIIDYLEDWFNSAYVIFAPFTLKVVKKSGRVSCAAAFVGEVLGLRPIIQIKDGVSTVIEKVRGDKAVVPKLVALAAENMVPKTPYTMVYGSLDEPIQELVKAMTKQVGYPPEKLFQIGAAISSNAGHQVVGVVIKGQPRA